MAYFQWQSAVQWFGITLGSSIWLAISGVVLLVRGHAVPGVVFLVAYAVLAAVAAGFWARRARCRAATAWQGWLAAFGALSLAGLVTSHVTGTYAAINLDEGGLLWLYVGVVLGTALLVADTHCRDRSDGARGAFGALFDLLAGLG
jgi:hypothetical protein